MKRVEKKCQQLENLATAVTCMAKDTDVIVDFCSGGVSTWEQFVGIFSGSTRSWLTNRQHPDSIQPNF